MTTWTKSHTIKIDAPAKLNLYLHVIGQREDGYHELDSLVAFASVGDLVYARPAANLNLTINGPFARQLHSISDNLVWRTANALQNITGVHVGADLVLTKNLPISSGIGGGSANAAATIRALIGLWDINQNDYDLSAFALALGADVPVCLYGQAAFMGGIGEEIAPGPEIPNVDLVIVNPGVPVSTPDVFKIRNGGFSKPAKRTGKMKSLSAFTRELTCCANDLTESAITIAPDIQKVLSALNSAGDCLLARMSGSGATCFGIFKTKRHAKRAASEIATKNPDWWIKTANLLN